jgi:Ca-activated chloride channel homolog
MAFQRYWFGVLICLTAFGPAKADTVLVLDASNSMWGEIGGTHKIDIAKETVGLIMHDWPESEAIGMIAYGHRRKSDCSDIETLVPISQGAAADIARLTQQLSPKGKTPLSDAVLAAAEALRYQESEATVVLVTDGVETCNQAPCLLATQLEQQGIDFTAHVIGFDMSLEEQASVACLAYETGGLFLPADNAGELAEAFGEVSEVLQEEQAPAIEREAALTVPNEVPASTSFSVQWSVEEAVSQVRIMLVPEGAGPNKAFHSINSLSPHRSFIAPNELGAYDVIVWDGTTKSVLARQPLLVVEGGVQISAPDNVTAGQNFTVSWGAEGTKVDRIAVATIGQAKPRGLYNRSASGRTERKMRAPKEAGRYEVRYIGVGDTVLATTTITVE